MSLELVSPRSPQPGLGTSWLLSTGPSCPSVPRQEWGNASSPGICLHPRSPCGVSSSHAAKQEQKMRCVWLNLNNAAGEEAERNG